MHCLLLLFRTIATTHVHMVVLYYINVVSCNNSVWSTSNDVGTSNTNCRPNKIKYCSIEFITISIKFDIS